MMRAESQERSVPRWQITATKQRQDDGDRSIARWEYSALKVCQDHTVCASSIAMLARFFKNAQFLTRNTFWVNWAPSAMINGPSILSTSSYLARGWTSPNGGVKWNI